MPTASRPAAPRRAAGRLCPLLRLASPAARRSLDVPSTTVIGILSTGVSRRALVERPATAPEMTGVQLQAATRTRASAGHRQYGYDARY